MSSPTNTHGIVLFDGVCNFCNRSVDFIIDRDRGDYFRFASLQSGVAANLLGRPRDDADPETMVLIEGDRRFVQSTAALRIARRLGGVWPALYVFIIVPRPVRDALYRWFAGNRYRWFGRRESCRVPTPRQQSRFLDSPAVNLG